MSNSPDTTAFDKGISSFLQILLPEKAQELMEHEADSQIRERIEALANKSTEGTLSETERQEYEGYVRANKFIAVLQRKARQLLNNSDSG